MIALALLALQGMSVPPSPTLTVFFDSSSHDIRAEWRPVIEEAARLAKGGQRLSIVGHSDSPGPPAANLRIAKSRADAVAAALVALGVAPGAIACSASGEEDLLVPTADGVREVQNRRVTITPLP